MKIAKKIANQICIRETDEEEEVHLIGMFLFDIMTSRQIRDHQRDRRQENI